MAPRSSKFDPYRAFKFRVRMDGKTVAGVTKVSALNRTVTSNEVLEGGDLLGPRQSPGQVAYDDVTLERGLSLDQTFESWANAVVKLHESPRDAKGYKRTVFIDVFDLAGNAQSKESKPVFSYKLHRAWVSGYSAMPALDAEQGGFAIQTITLKHEGWERL